MGLRRHKSVQPQSSGVNAIFRLWLRFATAVLLWRDPECWSEGSTNFRLNCASLINTLKCLLLAQS